MRSLVLPAGSALLLLAGVAALVILLYLLKPSPRRLTVSTGPIWQQVLKKRKRRPERLRWWLSVLLALGIALSIAAALTRPELAALSGTAADVVLVIDNAPSMATRASDGRTRLDHALQRARQLIASGGAGSRYLIADTMHTTGVPAFDRPEAALARLRAVQAQAAGTPTFPQIAAVDVGSRDVNVGTPTLGQPPAVAATKSRSASEQRQLWFVTDGVAGVSVPREARTVSVFEVADNLGITAFEVRARPSQARQHEAYLEVTNGSLGTKRVEVQIAGLGAPALVRELQIAGGATASLVLEVSAFAEGPLRASLRSDADALELDDVAYGYLPAKGRVRVALVTNGNADLARTLRLLPRLELVVIPPARLRDARKFDALVLDRTAPAQMPGVPALLIGPRKVPWLGGPAASRADTRLAQWDAAHPLLSGVSLRDVLVDRATVFRAAAGGVPVLAAVAWGPDGEPLIQVSREGRRFALVSFALEASNFALQASFPAFLSNAIDWLTREPRALSHRVGPVSVPLLKARVMDLDGREVPARHLPGVTLFEAREAGVYTAMAREQRIRLAVNLLDPGITRVNSGRFAQGAAAPAQRAAAPLATDPWILLLALAVLLLGLEWWTYHRRMTV